MYERLGEYNEAKELYEKALIIRKTIFGEDHADVAASYNILASVYERLGEYNQAKELYEKALIIKKKDFWWRSCRCSNKLWQLGNSVPTPGRIQSSQRTSRKSTENSEKDFWH